MDETISHKAMAGVGITVVAIIAVMCGMASYAGYLDTQIAIACVEAGQAWIDGNCQ